MNRTARRRSVVLFLGAVLLLGGGPGGHAQPSRPSVQTFFDAPYSPAYEDTMVARMSAGIDRYFDRYSDRVTGQRAQYWERDLSGPAAYRASVAPNRERLRTIIGLVDERLPVRMERFATGGGTPVVAETDRYTVHRVRWPVLDGITGEGLLLTPKGDVTAQVVALPDADQTPEQLVGVAPGIAGEAQVARRLAASGAQVLVPALINRQSTYSGGGGMVPLNPWRRGGAEPVTVMTNQPHREWIYRQAYVMGRHIIGLEVQKVLAALDWFEQQNEGARRGVVGYGEGGLLAFYAAAVDARIDAALVSGYFGPREALWREPVYRNVWGLLKQFGDAEIGSLIAPRPLIIEHSEGPAVDGPPTAEGDEVSAAVPGRLQTPPLQAVEQEVARLRGFFDGGDVQPRIQLVHGQGPDETIGPGSESALRALAGHLAMGGLAGARAAPDPQRERVDPGERQKRQVRQMTEYLHDLLRTADRERYAYFEGDRSSPAAWEASMDPYREDLYHELIGRVPQPLLPPNPRRRKVFDEAAWTGYEVVLDVWPDVFAWGLLALPKDMKPGEQRPVVVVQHGIGGTPTTPVRVDSYNRVLPKLVEEGYIVFAPHNPYQFNVRKATPLKASVFSVIVPQHRQIVRWLGSLEQVDAERIAFYGKSWGGRTALRVPQLVDEYALAICSAYFNQWPRKAMTVHYRTTYMLTSSIGIYEFNQGRTFGHAEMAELVAPRPFMVESGYLDGVAPHEWVGYEFAKVQRLYDTLGLGDRAELGFFMGGHEIDAPTTFPFLRKHLGDPRR